MQIWIASLEEHHVGSSHVYVYTSEAEALDAAKTFVENQDGFDGSYDVIVKGPILFGENVFDGNIIFEERMKKNRYNTNESHKLSVGQLRTLINEAMPKRPRPSSNLPGPELPPGQYYVWDEYDDLDKVVIMNDLPENPKPWTQVMVKSVRNGEVYTVSFRDLNAPA